MSSNLKSSVANTLIHVAVHFLFVTNRWMQIGKTYDIVAIIDTFQQAIATILSTRC